MTETETGNYNTGYNKDTDIEDGENYERIDQSEIDKLTANKKYEVPWIYTVAKENDEISLDNNNPTFQKKQDTFNEYFFNESDLSEKYYWTHNE